MSVSAGASRVVRLELTPQQTEQLAPLLQQAAADSENVLFFAVAVPFWRSGTTIWELQTTVISARIGHKIIKLVDSRKKEVRSL
jgi:hypothetical protein